MSDDFSRVFNIVGLLLNLAGILVLFRWGMPFRVPTHGAVSIVTEQIDKADVALEHIYTICGYVGLACLILGTVFQLIAVLMPPTKVP